MGRFPLDEMVVRLGDEVSALSDAVDTALERAVRALLDGDIDLAAGVVRDDEEINARRVMLEEDGIATIALQQPTASDLRFLAGVLEVATELERMGDYAKDVAGAVQANREWPPVFRERIPEIATIDGELLRRATSAFLARDAEAALRVAGERTGIGRLCGHVYHTLIEEAPRRGIEQAFELLSVVHDLVRFAERVVNVCERTVYVAYGEFVELGQREMSLPYVAVTSSGWSPRQAP